MVLYTLTKENYENVTMNIIKEFIDIFHSQQVETDIKFAELKAEIMLVKTENVSLRKLIVTTRLNQEKSQQYENRDTLKICGIKEPRLAPGQYENTDQVQG